jgi:hypothetical protein
MGTFTDKDTIIASNLRYKVKNIRPGGKILQVVENPVSGSK